MKKYAIAYLDTNENGFSSIEPFIFDDINNYQHGIKCSDELMKKYKRVALFEYEDELPESVTWDFVLEHKVHRYGC